MIEAMVLLTFFAFVLLVVIILLGGILIFGWFSISRDNRISRRSGGMGDLQHPDVQLHFSDTFENNER
jgi:hypothetical protein